MYTTSTTVNNYDARLYQDLQVELARLKGQNIELLLLVDELQAEIKSLIKDRTEMSREGR